MVPKFDTEKVVITYEKHPCLIFGKKNERVELKLKISTEMVKRRTSIKNSINNYIKKIFLKNILFVDWHMVVSL